MKKHCLIVDDNALVRETTACLVKHIASCPVRCCSDGEEALRVFGNDPDAFACVVTDFNMPGIDGLELGRRLRALAPDVKLLLVTGNPCALDGIDVKERGFHRVLSKPFDMALLRDALNFLSPAPGEHDAPGCGVYWDRDVPFFEGSRGVITAAA